MDEPLDRAYFDWLLHEIGPGHPNPRVTHYEMLRQLYSKEFVWLIPNDDNRIEDGKELRYAFLSTQEDLPVPSVVNDWFNLECSCLEIILSVAGRLSFQAEGEPSEWFWHLLNNLDISSITDSKYKRSPNKCWSVVDSILEGFVWRTYSFDGTGGLFPLANPHEDQTTVEIWYQLCAYLLELE